MSNKITVDDIKLSIKDEVDEKYILRDTYMLTIYTYGGGDDSKEEFGASLEQIPYYIVTMLEIDKQKITDPFDIDISLLSYPWIVDPDLYDQIPDEIKHIFTDKEYNCENYCPILEDWPAKPNTDGQCMQTIKNWDVTYFDNNGKEYKIKYETIKKEAYDN